VETWYFAIVWAIRGGGIDLELNEELVKANYRREASDLSSRYRREDPRLGD